MKHYRRVRDEIRAFIQQLPGALFIGESGGMSSKAQLLEKGIKSFLEQIPKDVLKKTDNQEENR